MKESIGGREMQQVPSHLFFNSSYVSNLYEFIAGVADTPVILHYMNSLYCEAHGYIMYHSLDMFSWRCKANQ
jgi:hypothetical protein